MMVQLDAGDERVQRIAFQRGVKGGSGAAQRLFALLHLQRGGGGLHDGQLHLAAGLLGGLQGFLRMLHRVEGGQEQKADKKE